MSEMTKAEEKKEKMDSKFARIKVVADRARQLEMGAQSMVATKGDCALDTAIQELNQGKINLFQTEKSDTSKPQTTDRAESPE